MGLVKTKSIDERITNLEEHLKRLKSIREKEPIGISEIICKKYVEFGNVQRVWEYLSENGYVMDCGKKYSRLNISQVIDSSDNNNEFSVEAKNMLKGARIAFKRK
jgi:hypothetical protein